MWSKQGRILDAASNPDGHNDHPNAERMYVNARQVVLHLVKLIPLRPERINPDQMYGLKIYLSSVNLAG